MLENEQGQTKGEGGSKLGNLERTYFLNVPLQGRTALRYYKVGQELFQSGVGKLLHSGAILLQSGIDITNWVNY